jgi:hypothetical protein
MNWSFDGEDLIAGLRCGPLSAAELTSEIGLDAVDGRTVAPILRRLVAERRLIRWYDHGRWYYALSETEARAVEEAPRA